MVQIYEIIKTFIVNTNMWCIGIVKNKTAVWLISALTTKKKTHFSHKNAIDFRVIRRRSLRTL